MAANPPGYQSGDFVQVFCKYCPWNAQNKFMVAATLAGSASGFPRIAKSDGWMDGQIVDVSDRDPHEAVTPPNEVKQGFWVRVKYSDKIWVDRTGHILSEKSLTQWIQVVGDNVRIKSDIVPKLSLLVVRWGGNVPIDEGRFDFALGDKLIQELMDTVHISHNRDLEVFTVHVSHSSDLKNISEQWAAYATNGTHKAGMYFLWGSNHDAKPGYVVAAQLHDLMERMESVGIVTRYPNSSTAYRMLTSKEYQAVCSSNAELAIPPTIMYPSSKLIAAPASACKHALEILSKLKGAPVTAGVAKVGFEWMGDGVRTFTPDNMPSRIQPLLDGAHGKPPVVILQERVLSVICEPRAFVYNGQIHTIRYTWNVKEDRETGRVHALRTCHASRAAEEKFGGDVKAQKFVERRVHEIVSQWNSWMLSITGEVPLFVRIDFLVARKDGRDSEPLLQDSSGNVEEDWLAFDKEDSGVHSNTALDDSVSPDLDDDSVYANQYAVWTCELGEIGSSMVGFREGKELLFKHVAKSLVPYPPLSRPSRQAPVLG